MSLVYVCGGLNIDVRPDLIILYLLNFDLLQVLDVEFHNVKALYRRAQAYMEISDLFSAELDIKKALEIDPQNR